MKLQGVKPGDIVRCDGALAIVEEIFKHELLLRWIGREQLRRVSARSIEAIWKRAR